MSVRATSNATSRRRRFLPLMLGGVLFAAGIGFALGIPTSRAGSYPALYVTFLVNHTFALTLTDGTRVGTTGSPGAAIPAGQYQLYLNDSSGAVMQFDLTGPGVSLTDNMSDGEEITSSYIEAFQPSAVYTYRDDLQAGSASTFSTTATVLPTPSSTATATTAQLSTGRTTTTSTSDLLGSQVKTDPFRGTLAATIRSSGALALDYKGKRVLSLPAGRYSIVATDGSHSQAFWLQEKGKKAIAVTARSFIGKRTLILDLKRGQWFFYSTLIGKKSYFVVTA